MEKTKEELEKIDREEEMKKAAAAAEKAAGVVSKLVSAYTCIECGFKEAQRTVATLEKCRICEGYKHMEQIEIGIEHVNAQLANLYDQKKQLKAILVGDKEKADIK